MEQGTLYAPPVRADCERRRGVGGVGGRDALPQFRGFGRELAELRLVVPGGEDAGSDVFFEVEEEFFRVQRGCPHPSAKWVQGRHHDYFVCDRCRVVLEEGWPDHHPEISRWLNEGGAVAR
jgi:hypothetical protein